MPGEEYTVTTEQRDKIVTYQEGHFGDVKGTDITPAKMSRAVSALANADGGELWVGISEDNRTNRWWRGFERVEDANAHIQVLADVMKVEPAYTFDFLRHPDSPGFVLHIEISKSRNIIRATDNKPYLRRGAQNLPVTGDAQLRQLERNKGITSYETETIATDPIVITNSATAIEFMLEVVPTAEPEEWLRKQHVIVDDLPTIAGVVLFADEPQSLLPKRSGIKVYRYTSAASEGTRESLADDPISIEGCAYQLIHAAVKKTQEIIGGVRKMGETGLEEVSYPPVTLHEIITNAVLHRDYSLADDIHVRIFDNRVEVESPGLLPAHITEGNILKERFSRNGTLVRLINKFPNPPNKDVGEGLNTAFSAMRMMRLRTPEIKQLEHSVVVYIRHTRLASPEDAIMDYLETHDSITNTIGRELTGVRSDATMKNAFVRLRDKGTIELIPGSRGRSSAWRTVKGTEPHQMEMPISASKE